MSRAEAEEPCNDSTILCVTAIVDAPYSPDLVESDTPAEVDVGPDPSTEPPEKPLRLTSLRLFDAVAQMLLKDTNLVASVGCPRKRE